MVNFEKGNFTRSDGTILFDKGALKAAIIKYLAENSASADEYGYSTTLDSLVREIISQGYIDAMPHYIIDQIYCHRLWSHKEIIDLGNRLNNFIKHMIFPEGILNVTKRGNSRYLTLSSKYLENETKDFSLDEGLDNTSNIKYYVVTDSGEITYDDEKIKEAIINTLLLEEEELAEYSDLLLGVVFNIMSEEDRIEYSRPFMSKIMPVWSALRAKVRTLINDMEVAGILESVIDENNDVAYIKISPDYLEKEISGFSLDEGIRRYDMTHDEIVAEIIDIAMMAYNSMTANDGVSIIFLIGAIRLNHGPHSTGGRRRPTVHLLKGIIKNLIDTNVLVYSKEDGKVKISPEYFEKETKDFSLDESLRCIIRKIISENVLSLLNTRNAAE